MNHFINYWLLQQFTTLNISKCSTQVFSNSGSLVKTIKLRWKLRIKNVSNGEKFSALRPEQYCEVISKLFNYCIGKLLLHLTEILAVTIARLSDKIGLHKWLCNLTIKTIISNRGRNEETKKRREGQQILKRKHLHTHNTHT